MMEQNAIARQSSTKGPRAPTQRVREDARLMESVLLQGDLSKLTPAQRVSYYKKVCESLGLNPLTRPFDYITLNNRLTLYAKKDAADQLRTIHGVSIDDVEIVETTNQFIVKVKGHTKDGRTDVEVGVVNKTDMQGNLANTQMKAVTKGKRRLTLSLCGLGWLDEAEVPTVAEAQPGGFIIPGGDMPPERTSSPKGDPVGTKPTGQPVSVTEDGEIENPLEKGIRLYAELCQRAEAAGVAHEPLPENVAIEQCRAMYSELFGFIKDAEAHRKCRYLRQAGNGSG